MMHHAELLYVAVPFEYQPVAIDVEVRLTDHQRLGIDEARQLQHAAWQMPAEGSQQVFVVRTTQITVEAQNALLKLFEEPPAASRFQLVVPTGTQLLPTLLSRVATVSSDSVVEQNVAWQQFFAASPKERLEQIQTWQKQKDITWLQQIKLGMAEWLRTVATPSHMLLLINQRLDTRGASNKMLLEALALDEQLQNR